MRRLRKILNGSFRAKVLVPVILVMIVILAVTVWFVDYRIQQQVEADAREALKTYDTVFAQLQENHAKYLHMRFESLANLPVYRSVFMTGEFASIQDQLARMRQNEGLIRSDTRTFVMYTPDDAPANAEPMIQPAELSSQFVRKVKTALAVSTAKTDMNLATASLNGSLYNIIAIAVYSPEHFHCGTLTFGEEMGSQKETSGQTVAEYFAFTTKPIALIGDGQVIASSYVGGPDKSLLESTFKQLNADDQPPGGIVKVTVGKEHYFCTSGRFVTTKNDPTLGYLLFNSYEPSSSVLMTQQLLLIASFIGIFIGSVFVWYFIKKATAPLRELQENADAVGRGDFSRRVNLHTSDEFGRLAGAFNQMTENVELSQSKLKQTVETLKTTQAQLIQSEKLSAVGEFVAGVAHELNNPLAAVMGFAELLKNSDTDEKNRRHLEQIFKSAQRCQKIVQSLLSFARRQPPERKPVQANKLIEEVLEMVAYPLRTSNVKVITHLQPKLPLIMADGHQIQQVVLNVINNSRQAIESHQGSGRITITTSHGSSKIHVVIHDNGPGIPAENLRRIFDPFFTTKSVGKGTGLGLSLCYGIIHEHGGVILAESRPGEGATFTIELPALNSDTEFEPHPPASGGDQDNLKEGEGKKILAVDDEDMLLDMIKEDLTSHSYEVTTAPNGETALRTLREKKFDLIVCDIKMPGLNGRQVYERLREESPETCRRMIFVTGDVVGEQLRDFLATEKRPCLAKPFSLGDLRKAIKSALAAL